MKRFSLNKIKVASFAELQKINGGVQDPSEDTIYNNTNTSIDGHDPSSPGIGTVTP